MNIWEAITLGVVQGLTEFLPVSSSGHLVLIGQLIGLKEPDLLFDVMVHFGTLLAVVVVFAPEIAQVLSGLAFWQADFRRAKGAEGRRLLLLLFWGTLPVAVAGLLWENTIVSLFGSTLFVGGALLFTGTVLWWVERRSHQGRPLASAKWQDALYVGLAQILALAPGVSRSGITIASSLARGLERRDAARFSFLLSLPAILGAVALQIGDLFEVDTIGAWLPVMAGMGAAAVSGFLAIRLLLGLIQKYSLRIFSYYTWLIGILVLFLALR